MASQKRASRKEDEGRLSVESNEDEQVSIKPTEESESEDAEEEGTTVLPPKKPKLISPVEEGGSKPQPDGSDCSSPFTSEFIAMPAHKPSFFSKKFSNEDEIALLKGLSIFWANGRNSMWIEFHRFIKDDLQHQFTNVQVSEKIRRLKQKFETNLKRARAKNGRLDFSDPHESLIFRLSKKLWGDDISIGQETRKSVQNKHDEKKKKSFHFHGAEEKELKELDKEEFASAYPLLWASFEGYPIIVKEKCFLIGREKAQELEQKWRELNEEMIRLELKRIDLIKRDLSNHLLRK